MSAQTETVVYDDLFTVVGRAKKARITDNIGNSQPTLDLFHAAGQVETEVGGESIEERLMYAYQDAEWMSDRQGVNTADKQGLTKSRFPWAFVIAPVNISKTDELKAQQSDDAAMDLGESKITMARQGIRTAVNNAMNGAASGKVMLGNQDLVRDSTSVGTLGGIDLSSAANSFYRSNALTSAVTVTTQTVTNLFDGWTNISDQFENASDINDSITHLATGGTLYSKLLQTLEGQGYSRFVGNGKINMSASSNGGQSVGEGPMFRDAMIYKDRAVKASAVYGYNINAMKLKIMKGANFAKTDFVPMDATGVLAKLCFYIVGIQFVPLNPRRTFVCTNFS